MEREYVRGNKEHWREVYEWAYGIKPKIIDAKGSFLGSDTCVILKRGNGRPFILDSASEDGKMIFDAVTTNPNWHEVKPWEKHYEPKPFDKVLGWNDNYPSDIRPDIFLYKQDVHGVTRYYCASGFWDRIKPYNEKEYIERLL